MFPRSLILLLTSLISLSTASPIDLKKSYEVTELPGLSSIPESLQPIMHAGQLEIHPQNNTNLFFWRFAKRYTATNSTSATTQLHKDELIIWLNGGPGCSSMDGALMEVGPLRVTDQQDVYFNNGSWMEVADIVFVDQPGGTGFSVTDLYDKELTEASLDFIKFLEKYFAVFPDDQKKKIWIAGESYAGQYIPYFADYILQENSKSNDFNVNLQGLLIGNGWIEPNLQSLSYVPFALENGLIQKQDTFMPKLLKQVERCQNAIDDPSNHDFENAQCTRIFDTLLRDMRDKSKPQNEQCVNMYDYRKWDSYPACGSNWPEDLPKVTQFLNIPAVQKGLNLRFEKEWHECDARVSAHFSPKTSRISFDLLPELLKMLPIMLFSGDKDIICNYLSTEMLINKLDIGGGQYGFSEGAASKNWFYDEQHVGSVQSENNLTYVKIFNSSHMVPYDLPEISRGLLDLAMLNTRDIDDKVLTPVYDVVNGTYHFEQSDLQKEIDDKPSDDNKEVDSGDGSSTPDQTPKRHGIPFYAFELIIMSILVYTFYYFYKSFTNQNKSSFLSSSSKKKKKQVHWFDESGSLDDDPSEEVGNNSKSMIGSVLNKLGYGSKYEQVEPGANRDIEMNEVDDQFIVQSDDEEFTATHDQSPPGNQSNRNDYRPEEPAGLN